MRIKFTHFADHGNLELAFQSDRNSTSTLLLALAYFYSGANIDITDCAKSEVIYRGQADARDCSRAIYSYFYPRAFELNPIDI